MKQIWQINTSIANGTLVSHCYSHGPREGYLGTSQSMLCCVTLLVDNLQKPQNDIPLKRGRPISLRWRRFSYRRIVRRTL